MTKITAICMLILAAILLIIANYLGFENGPGTFFYGLTNGACAIAFYEIFRARRKNNSS